MTSSRFGLLLLVGGAILTAADRPSAQGAGGRESSRESPAANRSDDLRMSGMGRLAHLAATGRLDKAIEKARARGAAERATAGAATEPVGAASEPQDDTEGPAGGQGETSIAVDSTGQHVVVGINDTRGFSLNPLSVSGFMYSDDGGATFVDGGQLPVTVPTSTIGATIYPQVFGDPEVKYVGGPEGKTFLYFSIVVKKLGASGTAQTMGVHRSNDYGHTWQGPFELPPATNPHGLLSGVNAADAADKEFADVDPDTGRVIFTWSNFTSSAPGGVEISSTFSDNAATATPPTWSTRVIIANTASDGQASIPRVATNGSPNVYVAWRRSAAGGFQNVGFAKSTNNGVSFSAPVNLAPANFFTMDQVLGNDRSNTSPSLAVDTSLGSNQGFIYVVYANNDNRDGADTAFQRSVDQGATFSAPISLNSRPGSDRAQWFPWVTVDKNTGRVYVHYYDQAIATDGDLSETSYQYSDDGGTTWSKPMPLTDRPFHAGYGNDTGQPNIGDYNQAVAQNGELFATWAGNPPVVNFADGQPTSASMTVPDMYFKRVPAAVSRLAVSLGAVSFTEFGPAPLGGNGFIDPNEGADLVIPLRNYVTNGLIAGSVTGITATLTTSTPGVLVQQGSSSYPSLPPGATASNGDVYQISIGSAFQPGTRIELTLFVTSAQGSTTLLFTITSGTPTPLPTTLLSQNFNGVAPGSLPAGWSSLHGGGNNTVVWTTSSLPLGLTPGTISNAAFHTNANDGLANNHRRWERLLSPTFAVPAAAAYVTVEFDVAYDTEDEPAFNIQTYDGMLLRVTDSTSGRIVRSVAVEAFAEEFTTGTAQFYPKHLIRDDNPAYFQNLSAWGGDSAGYRHVHLKLPGMAGSTAQLRFEYTQDFGFHCASIRPGHRCGVLVDNVVVQSVQVVTPTEMTVGISRLPGLAGEPETFTATVTTSGGAFPTDGAVTFLDGGVVIGGPITLVNGQAQFTTSFAVGDHPISVQYASSSGLFGGSSVNFVLPVFTATTVSFSSNNLTFAKQRVGTTSSPPFSVQASNTGGAALMFSFFDGMPATPVFTIGGGDFQGQTNCPLTSPGLLPGQTCDFFFSFSPTAPGVRSAGFMIADNTLDSPQTITLNGIGFAVDEPTVVQTLAAVGARLQALQNPDGGWFFEADATDCFQGPGVSCPNTIGVTGLGLLAAHVRTGDPGLLAAATDAGDLLLAKYADAIAQTPLPRLPFSQDIEFLMTLAQLTGNATYSTTAQAWFDLVVVRFPNAADRVADIMARRHAQGLRSSVAWDVASAIRAAKAVGHAPYALALANSLIAHEADWMDTDPSHRWDMCPSQAGCGPADNPYAYDYTLLGMGSFLWAAHDLQGFALKVAEYRDLLKALQDPAGSWDGGLSQMTAYILVGLASVGGADAEMLSAAAFFIANQLMTDGFPSYVIPPGRGPENVAINAEIARAMAALFNTPAGENVLVAPAQLSRVTFSSVSAPGRTNVVAADLAAPPIEEGFEIFSGLTYDVHTTAAASGNRTVCFSIPWVNDPVAFWSLRILHKEGGVLVDRTILPPDAPASEFASDFDKRRMCARTTSLSLFAVGVGAPDNTPPTVSVTLTPSVLWPPNHQMVAVTATIDVLDNVDPSPTVTLLSITSNEPDGGGAGRKSLPDIQDAAFGTDDRTFLLRAERNYRTGRIYTVVYRVMDGSGNQRDVAVQVSVPHDR